MESLSACRSTDWIVFDGMCHAVPIDITTSLAEPVLIESCFGVDDFHFNTRGALYWEDAQEWTFCDPTSPKSMDLQVRASH
jgi:hypothetical protein